MVLMGVVRGVVRTVDDDFTSLLLGLVVIATSLSGMSFLPFFTSFFFFSGDGDDGGSTSMGVGSSSLIWVVVTLNGVFCFWGGFLATRSRGKSSYYLVVVRRRRTKMTQQKRYTGLLGYSSREYFDSVVLKLCPLARYRYWATGLKGAIFF